MQETQSRRQSLAELYQRLETSTQELLVANRAYTEWSQCRTSACKLAGQYAREERTHDEAYEPLLKIIEISTRKCEGLEQYIDKKRHLHEVLQNKIDAEEDGGLST